MNATTKKFTTTVSLSHSEFGTPRPQIELRFPPRTSGREVNAALYTLAARLEMATPEKEGWVVRFQAEADIGWVWIEVIDGFDREIKSGMKVLREVVG